MSIQEITEAVMERPEDRKAVKMTSELERLLDEGLERLEQAKTTVELRRGAFTHYHDTLPGISLSPLAGRGPGRGGRPLEGQWIGSTSKPGASSPQPSPPEEERELRQNRDVSGRYARFAAADDSGSA